MLIATSEIVIGLLLLVFGADRFVTGASRTASLLRVPPLIIGLTVVGMATSVPEILVGSIAALDGKTHIAIGNAIGSNIANIALVLGGTILLKPVIIHSNTLRREYIIMLAASILALLVMLDLFIGRIDAMILLVSLAAATGWLIYLARHPAENDPLITELQHEIASSTGPGKAILLLTAGLLLLLAGAEILVSGAVSVAEGFGISDLVIGLTIIAVGTSLPELAASIVSVVKKEADIAIGNIIGSNMFNMLAVLGIPVLFHPEGFGSDVLTRDFLFMMILTLFMGWIIFLREEFSRLHGAFLLTGFIGYQAWLFTGG